MKVLFLSSGNTKNGISPIIKSQGESLKRAGVELDYFTIKGGGLKGYLKSIPSLRKYLSKNDFNVVHAHYGLCAIVACLSRKKERVVVSFMGDDIVGSNNAEGKVTQLSKLIVRINKFFAKKYCDYSIVKSKEMFDVLNIEKCQVIPNGVNYESFYELDQNEARNYIGEQCSKQQILFCSNPDRVEKNFKLAEDAQRILNDGNVLMKCLHGIEQGDLVYHYNAADCLLLTSFHEGSPNVIKEAMACNLPIVSTDVGDVREVIGNTAGCFLSSYEPSDVAEKLRLALAFKEPTTGREDIKHLESQVIAEKIIAIYTKIQEK